MIKMIKGNHGVVENGKVVAKDKYSDPFEISEEKENELIASGFAKKVDAPKKADAKKPAETKPADTKSASKTEPKTNDKSKDVKKDVK